MKVLIIYNNVWSYRVKIFELLNQKVDLTVGFSDPVFIEKKYAFKTLYLPIKKAGPFVIHKNNLNKICNNYDVVIGMFNIRWVSIMFLALISSRKYALAFWGIGVRASYDNKFDSKSAWDQLRYTLCKRVDAVVFYSAYPIEKYVKAGLDRSKLFVANNTTEVVPLKTIDAAKKNNFLFVGTLYPQKGFPILLQAYLKLTNLISNTPKLDIIGDGPESTTIKAFISAHKLEDKIMLLGSIYDPEILSNYYATAIACISPNQAGLSVANSMGNGTIFVTEKEAITGGEIFNIQNKINGIVYSGGADELADNMKWIVENREKAIEMCKNALDFYNLNRTPQKMADSLYDAVVYSKKNIWNA